METLEQQIQPFIQPLISRIEALQTENKLLRTTIDQLKATKTQSKATLPENRLNRTQTQVQGLKSGAKTIPPKVVAPVEPKPVPIKKNPIKPTIVENPPVAIKVGDKNHTAEKPRPGLKTDKEAKEPATQRKEPNARDPKNLTSPKSGSKPTGKSIPTVTKDPKDSKDAKQAPKATTDNKNPKVIAGGKQTKEQPKVQVKVNAIPTTIQAQKVQEQLQQKEQPVVPVVQEKKEELIAPMIESVEVPAPEEPKTSQQPPVNIETQVKKDELLAQQSAMNVPQQEQKEQAHEPAPPVENKTENVVENSEQPTAAQVKIESESSLPALTSEQQIL